MDTITKEMLTSEEDFARRNPNLLFTNLTFSDFVLITCPFRIDTRDLKYISVVPNETRSWTMERFFMF